MADADQIPVTGDDAGVVTMMTLHTAKGLEFPVVFVTALEDGVFPHLRALGDPRELEEERRLAYGASPAPSSGCSSPARRSARAGVSPPTTRRPGSWTSCRRTPCTGARLEPAPASTGYSSAQSQVARPACPRAGCAADSATGRISVGRRPGGPRRVRGWDAVVEVTVPATRPRRRSTSAPAAPSASSCARPRSSALSAVPTIPSPSGVRRSLPGWPPRSTAVRVRGRQRRAAPAASRPAAWRRRSVATAKIGHVWPPRITTVGTRTAAIAGVGTGVAPVRVASCTTDTAPRPPVGGRTATAGCRRPCPAAGRCLELEGGDDVRRPGPRPPSLQPAGGDPRQPRAAGRRSGTGARRGRAGRSSSPSAAARAPGSRRRKPKTAARSPATVDHRLQILDLPLDGVGHRVRAVAACTAVIGERVKSSASCAAIGAPCPAG